MISTEVKNPKKYRLLRVFEYMQNTDADNPLNVTQILEKLAEDYGITADRKSIMRDLQTIAACGYELEECKNHNDGKFMADNHKAFKGYQLKMLADAVASARFLPAQDAREMVESIMTLGTKTDRELLQKVVIRDESLNVATKNAKNNFYEVLEAIREHKQITFQYNPKYLLKPKNEDLANEGKLYHVSPYYLVTANNDYYMIGCTGEHSNFSHYRLSRMVDVLMDEKVDAKPLKDSTTYQDLMCSGKSIGDYLREHINMWFGATQRVNLHCKQWCRLDVLAMFGNKINMYNCSENKEYFSTSVDVQAQEGFFGWVAGFGGNIIITAPESVRQAYKDYLQKQLAAYL